MFDVLEFDEVGTDIGLCSSTSSQRFMLLWIFAVKCVGRRYKGILINDVCSFISITRISWAVGLFINDHGGIADGWLVCNKWLLIAGFFNLSAVVLYLFWFLTIYCVTQCWKKNSFLSKH